MATFAPEVKNFPRKWRGLGHVTVLKVNISGMDEAALLVN